MCHVDGAQAGEERAGRGERGYHACRLLPSGLAQMKTRTLRPVGDVVRRQGVDVAADGRPCAAPTPAGRAACSPLPTATWGATSSVAVGTQTTGRVQR